MSTPDVASLSYEQAREELQTVVRRLETGAATLEESMELWERGEALAARCQQWLDGARERLAKVQQGATATTTEDEG
ncbi:exodeoxyribonuclease VII small subunit [Georgenia sp. H159]|uniref:exodeoxyribonuclease VII small subunit n=1 Tax=Georgenia sp. H159 TaxID=3076115 RepID=UPI002D77D07E|nr:exodeoxyribonuclease VII small subunit [Georgenia sp. H159]